MKVPEESSTFYILLAKPLELSHVSSTWNATYDAGAADVYN